MHVKVVVTLMGEVFEIEKDLLGQYRRVRLMLDINKPLPRFRDIKDRSDKMVRVEFA